ncbi:MAG: hypothetical protein ACXWZD_12700 [Actinomycetota bacterium]
MESQGGPKPSFDIAAMSMATKGILIVGVLLLIDSFLAWQQVCVVGFCVSASAWGGNGSWAGLLMGILLIVLILFEISKLANMSMQLPIAPSKATAYLGFAVVAFGLIKFLLVVSNEPGFGAWVGIILLAALGYFSFLYLKAEETAVAPPQTEL